MDEIWNEILKGMYAAIGALFVNIFVKVFLSKPGLIVIFLLGGAIVWNSIQQDKEPRPNPNPYPNLYPNPNPNPNPNYKYFPKSTCGDPIPTNASAYPVNFYPVRAPYSEYNLARIRSAFCKDAFPNRRNNGEVVIQIASFTSQERARNFAQFIQSQIPSSYIGPPTTVYK